MHSKHILIMYILYITLRVAKGAVPGLFFWKPRLGLDLSVPTTESGAEVNLPNKNNIGEGLVVLVEGYSAGMTIIGLASGLTNAKPYPHFNPTSAWFYTQAYRWALRYISSLPFWVGGHGGHFCDTLQVWKRRFYYMDEFVPSWLRSFLFYVNKEDGKKRSGTSNDSRSTPSPPLADLTVFLLSPLITSPLNKLWRLWRSSELVAFRKLNTVSKTMAVQHRIELELNSH